MVCPSVIAQPRQRGGLGLLGAIEAACGTSLLRNMSKISKLQHIMKADSVRDGVKFENVGIKRQVWHTDTNFQRKPGTGLLQKKKCGAHKKFGI